MLTIAATGLVFALIFATLAGLAAGLLYGVFYGHRHGAKWGAYNAFRMWRQRGGPEHDPTGVRFLAQVFNEYQESRPPLRGE